MTKFLWSDYVAARGLAGLGRLSTSLAGGKFVNATTKEAVAGTGRWSRGVNAMQD
jgi:hypothetical protein